jgi:Amt family ammonium transporter
VLPFLIFIFIWSTLVYDPIARWSWNPQGWSALWGTLDFAGGTVVHIVAATTTAVSANVVKVRARIRRQILPVEDLNAEEAPSNVPYIVLGTTLLWFGWFGFNGGSALGANLRAVSACISTNIAACMGGITGCFLDWYLEPYTVPPHVTEKPKRKFSIISFCNGVIAGLVTITPAAGFVRLPLYP